MSTLLTEKLGLTNKSHMKLDFNVKITDLGTLYDFADYNFEAKTV